MKTRQLLLLCMMIFFVVISSLSSFALEIKNITPPSVVDFVNTALPLYENDPDYTQTIVGQYTSGGRHDHAENIALSWDAIPGTSVYTFHIEDENGYHDVRELSSQTNEITVGNLFADTVYAWYVTSDNGGFTDTERFKTSNTPRFITVPNMTQIGNIRDIGGWTGLNQGKAYRGGRLNYGTTSFMTAEGKSILTETLGIKTEIDFRADSELAECYRSLISDDVSWYNADYNSTETFRLFADPRNYPIYYHCVGGADRTGYATQTLMALCDVPSAVMDVDYELTSFSMWGERGRVDGVYGDRSLRWGSTMQRLSTDKAAITEASLLEKGVTRSMISNIRSILKGDGVCFASLDNVPCHVNNYECALYDLGAHTVKNVTLNNNSVEYTQNGSILTFSTGNSGIGCVSLDDDYKLYFDVKGESDPDKILEVENLFRFDMYTTVSGTRFTTVTENAPDDAIIIAAAYKDGRLAETKMLDADGGTYTFTGAYDAVKVFAFDAFGTLIPLTEAETVTTR